VTQALGIALKIPDNAAYTALTTLRRLGFDLAAVERSDVVVFDDEHDIAALARIEHDETLFNPNKHRLVEFADSRPREGEVWIALRDLVIRPRRYVAWRLFERGGAPAPTEVVMRAAQQLLCNPAVEEALFRT
jgi:phosphoribosylformylglycinamidine (FGAM) synthase PurS component